MQEILKNPHKQFYLTFRHRHKNGHYIWLEGMMTNMLHDETIKAIVFNLRDVTPNKEAEEEIKTLNESLEKKVIERTVQLEAVNKELEAFTYSVSHDLRAPLRIIDGYTEMLVSDYQKKLDEEAKRMFGIITGNVRKMGQLIDDLLNLSQTSRKELLLYPTDMNKLVQSVIDDQFSLNGNKAEIKIETLLPAKCDSGLLQQVWSNLISNAIKYSGKEEHPVIRINSFRQKGEIIYQIEDNGVGFDMKYAGQLFGVFQRLHKATEFEGTGVGLALVKRIVAKHNGRVWAESEPGKGATFFFSLPAR
jgi:light-regulated signal transduction histidine kinase (bacteriophytochrome)